VDPEEQLTPPPVTVPFPDPAVPTFSVYEFRGTGSKVADTAVAAVIVMLQDGAAPEQAPPQPVNMEPGPAVAESVTGAPATRLALQPDADPDAQLNPPPEIVPVPVPLVDAESRYEGGGGSPKDAETEEAAVTVRLQEGEVPEHAPPQPVNTEPAAALATRVTDVPSDKLALQPTLDPDVQFRPPPEMVPAPGPLVEAESRTVEGGAGSKLAVTAAAAVIVKPQEVEVPEQAPPQPENTDPGPAAAVSVNEVPETTLELQPELDPDVQLRPPPVTVPDPVPTRDADRR
jgi:hypothetical protein